MRDYKRKTEMQLWHKNTLKIAIEQIRSTNTTVTQTSKDYNIPLSTLKRRLKEYINNNGNDIDIKLGRFKCTFSPELETILLNHILEMDKIYFGLTPMDLRRLAFDFAEAHKIEHRFNKVNKIAGEDWYQSFMKRHPSLTLRTPEKTSLARASGFNKIVVNKFYDLLDNLLNVYNFAPSRIYNVDESGISTVPNHIPKVISIKGKRQVGGLVSAERGQTITCVFCCNAAGNFIPPLIIFPRKKINLELKDGCPPDTLAVFHPSGWMQTEIFYPVWFDHFCKFAKPTEDDPVLLLLDGHVTHVKNLALVIAARQKNVHILCFPPHTSHKLQPLDISFMKPFKTYYSQGCSTYLRSHPGQVITIRQVGQIFGSSYMRAAVPQNSISGFERAGIYPPNRFKFGDEDFAPAMPTDRTNCCEPSVEKSTECNIQKSSESPNENILPVANNYLFVDVTNLRTLDDEPVPGTSQNFTTNINNCDTTMINILESAKDIVNNILPVPKIDCDRVKRSTKRKGSTAIITSDIYLRNLQGTSAVEKKTEPKQKKVFTKRRKTTIKQEKPEIKNTRKNNEEENEDCACFVCTKLYSESVSNAQWIQCQECKSWCHEECVKNDIKHSFFVCAICIPKIIQAHLLKI